MKGRRWYATAAFQLLVAAIAAGCDRNMLAASFATSGLAYFYVALVETWERR